MDPVQILWNRLNVLYNSQSFIIFIGNFLHIKYIHSFNDIHSPNFITRLDIVHFMAPKMPIKIWLFTEGKKTEQFRICFLFHEGEGFNLLLMPVTRTSLFGIGVLSVLIVILNGNRLPVFAYYVFFDYFFSASIKRMWQRWRAVSWLLLLIDFEDPNFLRQDTQ